MPPTDTVRLNSLLAPLKDEFAWDTNDKGEYLCLLCKDSRWRDRRSAVRHEDSRQHQSAVQFYNQPGSPAASSSGRSSPMNIALPMVHEEDLPVGTLELLLREAASGTNPLPPYHEDSATAPIEPHSYFAVSDLVDEDGNFALDETPDYRITSWLANDDHADRSDSDSEDGYIPDDQPMDSEDDSQYPSQAIGRVRTKSSVQWDTENPQWFPWPDKQLAILDILHHLPGSLYSNRQMQVLSWLLRAFGVDHVPSVDVLSKFESEMQERCGIRSLRRKGPFGNIYYMNDLAGLISQEIANPRIRPHLRVYPEDASPCLEECWQADKWLREYDPALLTPMIRVHKEDFYTFEPTRLRDGRIVIPERWFTTSRNGESHFCAYVYATYVAASSRGPGYIVDARNLLQISADDLSLSLPQLRSVYQDDHTPDPTNIIGVLHNDGAIRKWTFTDPSQGNRWRHLAKGHRVATFMMWLYCDDTSGNVSKKWNKHNSFLFTPAGLPRVMVHRASNIHFLSTSNIAPPLEMLEGIVSQLEKYQDVGIWAWDICANELILIIPAILALLGDNPMQSELASHIGLKGKFFCRICHVYDRDGERAETGSMQPTSNTQTPPQPTLELSEQSSRAASPASDTSVQSESQSKGRGGKQESFVELVDRATRFLGESELRHKEESLEHLRKMFRDVTTLNGKTQFNKSKTATGLKDGFLDFYADQVFSLTTSLKGQSKEQKATTVSQTVASSFPPFPFNPVWRIRGLDPHSDTPVEVLHTLLLGFVKYFWRDAVSGIKDDTKSLLKSRIDSLDTSGLGISPPSGQRLVTYAGSLTGSDFRIISQIAVFVLYDLLPDVCFQAWVALSSLVPLVWQPRILVIDDYLSTLEKAIEHFLTCTARWTPRWFNKPKFHLLRHLPSHIRRFGPAILFATENFESYNSTVRDHSVHSNRLAPSRDIALGMAQFSRIRHILSGGAFCLSEPPETTPGSDSERSATQTSEDNNIAQRPLSDDPHKWRTAAQLPQNLVHPYATSKNIISDYLGFEPINSPYLCGACSTQLLKRVRWSRTQSGEAGLQGPQTSLHSRYTTYKTVTAQNGDVCLPGSFVLLSPGPSQGVHSVIVGCIAEIIQESAADDISKDTADYVALHSFDITAISAHYSLPSIKRRQLVLCPPADIVCSINVQHNCYAHKCQASGARTVQQEREATTKTTTVVVHRHPDDLLLNTNQMRDAVWLQQLRFAHIPSDRHTAIMQGAQAEIDARKERNLQASTTARKRKEREGQMAQPSRKRIQNPLNTIRPGSTSQYPSPSQSLALSTHDPLVLQLASTSTPMVHAPRSPVFAPFCEGTQTRNA